MCPNGTYSPMGVDCLKCPDNSISESGAAKCTPCRQSEVAIDGECVSPEPKIECGPGNKCFDQLFQPRVTTVEKEPSRKVAGIISMPNGSPWCRRMPTYWTPGHKSENDTPNCLTRNKKWIRPFVAQLDDNDDLNDIDSPEIDRHDCGVLDVNNDGIPDLYCLIGANAGTGEGFNELYFTRSNGSLRKIRQHGLQKYPTLRGRHTAVLDDSYVLIATKGVLRDDGRVNYHTMFQKLNGFPWFKEIEGPWNVYTNSSGILKGDFDGDGREDFIISNRMDYPIMVLQNNWKQIPLKISKRNLNWRSMRLGDINGDGIQDLVVSYFGHKGVVNVFKGIPRAPFFDFAKAPYFHMSFPYAIPDVELIDINRDGKLDVYVVQTDTRPEAGQKKYCAGYFVHKQWWRYGNQPPLNFVPPQDSAKDVLLLNQGRHKFTTVELNHSEPGCGNLVRPWKGNSLLLTQGDFVRPGHQLVLEWD